MNNCNHTPINHSWVKDNFLYCEICHIVCDHHAAPKNTEQYISSMRKRSIFCRGGDGHTAELKDIRFDKNKNVYCKEHPNATKRWKVIKK